MLAPMATGCAEFPIDDAGFEVTVTDAGATAKHRDWAEIIALGETEDEARVNCIRSIGLNEAVDIVIRARARRELLLRPDGWP